MNCPICAGEARRVFEKHSYWVCDCVTCSHRFCEMTPDDDHLSQVYGDAYFTEGGAGYADYLAEADLLIAHGRRYGQMLKRHMQPGRVLDVGAAAGFILKGLTEEGWSGDGVEPNPRMAAHARQTYSLNVQPGSLESVQADGEYDLVSMVQVVAHFYDLQRAFAAANRALKPGGYCLIETWDKDSLPAKMLGENWHEYSPPSVLHWFARPTLTHLAGKHGLQPVAHGRPQKWLKGHHAKSLVRYKLETTPLKFTAPLLNVVPDELPIPYPTLDIFWVLFRKA
jgi:SAM-dependent methyltransferase